MVQQEQSHKPDGPRSIHIGRVGVAPNEEFGLGATVRPAGAGTNTPLGIMAKTRWN